MCIIIIRTKLSITATEQDRTEQIPSRIRRIPFQDRPYQKTRCPRRPIAEIRAWLRRGHGSNEPSLEGMGGAHRPPMAKLLTANDATGNQTNINHPLPLYSLSNSNNSTVKVPAEFL